IAAQARGRLNSDDRTTIEFAFARAVAGAGGFDPDELRASAHGLVLDRPDIDVDWARAERARIGAGLVGGAKGPALARPRWRERDPGGAREAGDGEPVDLSETAIVAELRADAGDEAALRYIARLRPVEADALRARLRFRQGRIAAAVDALVAALDRYHQDPWPMPELMRPALDLAPDLARKHPLA